MSADKSAQQRHDLANSLLAMTDLIAPIFDTADGMRADMERRGWSPTAAEQAALAWLLGAMSLTVTGQQR